MASSTSILPYLRRTPILLIGVLFLLPGLIFGILGIALTVSDARFASDGITAQGIVLSKDIKHATGSSGTSYSVRYRFTLPDDRTFEGSSTIDVHDWENLVERGPIAIQYLASDPSSNRTASAGSFPADLVFMGIGGGVLLAGGYLVWRGSRTLVEDRRLLRIGTEARATVGAVEPTNIRINWQLQWRIAYTYRDADGQDHESRSWLMPESQARRFSRGAHARIRYDPAAPAKSLWIDRAWEAPAGRHTVDAAAPPTRSGPSAASPTDAAAEGKPTGDP
jgi:hypothetical protein